MMGHSGWLSDGDCAQHGVVVADESGINRSSMKQESRLLLIFGCGSADRCLDRVIPLASNLFTGSVPIPLLSSGLSLEGQIQGDQHPCDI